MPTASQTYAGQIKEKRDRLQKFFEKKGADGTLDISATDRDQMKSLNDELTPLVVKWTSARADEKAELENKKALEELGTAILPPGFHGATRGPVGTDGQALGREGKLLQLGDHFVASSAYKAFAARKASGESARAEFEATGLDAQLKTLFSTTAGFDPFVTRLPGQVLSPQQMPKVVDLIPQGETTQHSIKWMLEDLFTNNALETAEAGPYGENAYRLTEQITPVNKIACFIPTTDEQLADAPQMRDYLNGRLEMGLKQRFDFQLLNGNGTTPNLKGLYNIAGINTQAQGTDPTPDAFYKAMVQVQTSGFADPSGIIMHPVDWQGIRLLRTTQGLYIWGSPDSVGPQRMWGLPVVTTTYNAQGTGLVADFAMYTQIFYRKGVDFLVSNSHLGYFATGQLAVRADMRVAFIVTRASAVSKVTGIA